MSRQNDALIEQAVKTVRKAGALLTDQSAIRNIWAKSETDFVTNVDVTVQETLKAQLAWPRKFSLWGKSRTTADWTGTAPAGF